MIIDGEDLSERRMQHYRDVFRNDCVKFAGEFHTMTRSRKFRARWPNEYDYAEQNWKNFVSAVRQLYAQQLGNPHTSPDDKETIHRCLVIDAMTNQLAQAVNLETDKSLQLAPNSEQFAGDRRENARTEETYGIGPGSFKDIAMRTAARFQPKH